MSEKQLVKKCKKCGKIKQISEYYKERNGYKTKCKECIRKLRREKSKEHASNQDKVIPDEKHCPRCDQIKSREDFYKNKSAYDGLSSYCGDCVRKHQLELYGGDEGWKQKMYDYKGGREGWNAYCAAMDKKRRRERKNETLQ